jgi:hypothetical protein
VAEAAIDAVESAAALDDGGVGELALLRREALAATAATASGLALRGCPGRRLAGRRLRWRLRADKDAGQQDSGGCSQDYVLSHGYLEIGLTSSQEIDCRTREC